MIGYSIKELLMDVPKESRDRCKEIMALTDDFCNKYLNEEYKAYCREMASLFCDENSPATRGKPQSWAAGIVYSLGKANLLTDPGESPHMTSAAIAKGFGVSPSTMQSKARVIREELAIMPLDPDWCLPSNYQKNPLVWMCQVNGMMVDIRTMPAEAQQEAYEQGIIPYVPAYEDDTPEPNDFSHKYKETGFPDEHEELDAPTVLNESQLNFRFADYLPENISKTKPLRTKRDDQQEANELAEQAFQAESSEEAVSLAKRACELDPHCVQAYEILAENTANSLDEFIAMMEKAVKVGHEALGEDFFKENEGHFWGIWETRPYMRVKHQLGLALTKAEKFEEAATHYEEMLKLNPNDNQGVRELAMAIYLRVNNLEGARSILKRYAEDWSGFIHWSRVLERLLSHDSDSARKYLNEARKQCPFAEDYITGRKAFPDELPDFYELGKDSEGIIVAEGLRPAWSKHRDAMSWLKAQLR